MDNIADFLLKNYYEHIYPEPLNNKKIIVPDKYNEFKGKQTYIKLAGNITMETNADEALKKLHKLATRKHIAKEKEESVIETFPLGNNELISEYALRVFNDTHALDSGKHLRNKFNKFLIKTYGENNLRLHGVIENIATSVVWSKGVTINKGFVGTSLLDIDNISLRNNKVVWVFENINTAQRIIQNGYSFPFVITSGRPTRACFILLKRLQESGTKLYYHGDMDLVGVDIYKSIEKELKGIVAPFMNIYEYNDNHKVKISKNQKSKNEDSLLINLIKEKNTAVYEEQLDLGKCQVLYELG